MRRVREIDPHEMSAMTGDVGAVPPPRRYHSPPPIERQPPREPLTPGERIVGLIGLTVAAFVGLYFAAQLLRAVL
jgi:hypothetical protein